MVSRGYIYCVVCDKPYITRIGVGIEKNCRHTFDCIGCGLPITLNMVSMPGGGMLQAIENCRLASEQIDGTVINLHPSFAIDIDKFHKDQYFASLEYISLIFRHVEMRAGPTQDVALQFEVPNAPQVWAVVKNLLAVEGKPAATKSMQRLIVQFRSMREKYKPVAVSTVDDVVFSFFHDMFSPRIDVLISEVRELMETLRSENNSEFNRFRKFYIDELSVTHQQRYVSIFHDYFLNYDHFKQMLVHARVVSIDIANKIVGSKRFDDVKLFYGQAYETMTSHYVIFACLNNIKQGRLFDEFKSMSLSKYIKDVEKSKKSNPFSDAGEFQKFTECENSSLRNGSHHAAIWRDGERILYRSGGTGAQQEMAYVEYLHSCNTMAIALGALFIIERVLLSDVWPEAVS